MAEELKREKMERGLEDRAGVCEPPGSQREPRVRKIRNAETLTA